MPPLVKISVVIPTYNSARTVSQALGSVWRQTLPPDEILVLDDGSTDETVSILRSYKSQITLFEQKNQGVAAARNALCRQSSGDLIAFLDHDDIWHPRYLEFQRSLFQNFGKEAAFFTGHVDFRGYGDYFWNDGLTCETPGAELISPVQFVKRYNSNTRHFASMSYCCIPKSILQEIGEEPFCVTASGADDFYLFNLLPLCGSIVYSSVPMVAYRIISEAQSENRVKGLGLSVHALEVLEGKYEELGSPELQRAFRTALASRRRQYAKYLMGAGNVYQARNQICKSLRSSIRPASVVKSAALLLLTYLPSPAQPGWPSNSRS